MGTAIIAIALMAGVGLALGCVIGMAAKVFFVSTDPRVEEVLEMLPGANCGGCGLPGCSEFAKAVVASEVSPGGCPVCSADMTDKIAGFLGVDAGNGNKKVAVIFCGGSDSKAKKSTLYNGVNDCISASLVAGGPKDCRYGCLGLASCARACPFNAIEISDGLAYVHPEVCVGCGKCVDVCPRNLIKLVPASVDVHVYCSSPEKGAPKRKYCEVACIGCRKCFKAAEEGQIEMNGFLASVNYDNAPSKELVEKAQCPTGCLESPEAHLAGRNKKENAA